MEMQKHRESEECFWTEFHDSFLHVYPASAIASSLPPAVSFPSNTYEPHSLQHYTKVSLNSLGNLNLYKTVCSVVAPGEQRANCFAPESTTRDTLGLRINCHNFDFHTCLGRNFYLFSLLEASQSMASVYYHSPVTVSLYWPLHGHHCLTKCLMYKC